MTHINAYKQNGAASKSLDGQTTEPLEKSVLGSLLIRPELFFDINTIVQPVMFSAWLPVADIIWSKLDENGKTDAQEIAYEVKKSGIADASKIFALVSNASTSRIIDHAQSIRAEYIRTNELQIAQETVSRLSSGEAVEDVLNWQEGQREMLHGQTDDKNQRRIDRVMGFLDRVGEIKSGKAPSGWTTGFDHMDARIGGFVPGRLIVLAARPAMGKTTLALQMTFAPAKIQKVPCLVVSLEMSHDELLQKYAQGETGIARERIQLGQITDQEYDQITQSVETYYDLPIFIEDTAFTFVQIKNMIRQYVRKYGVRVVMIDYLQLVEDPSRKHGTKTLEVEAITRGLKLLAKSEGICIICLSQLSRAVETRGGDKRPQLSDLRHSGGIEQDADQILFPYRGSYYNILENSEGIEDHRTEVIIAKNRHKSNGMGSVYFNYSVDFDQLIESSCQSDVFDGRQEDKPSVQVKPVYNATAGMTPTNDDDDIPF